MGGPSCHRCVYSVCDPDVWHRSLWMREPIVPRCANHPQWPGQLHDVPGVPCRNYRPKPVLPAGDVRLIPLGDGFYAYVDAADYDWLSRHTWHLNNGYAARREKGRVIYMHRAIMQPPKDMLVDHFDGSKTNNCRVNLHVCTPAENHRNQRKRHGARSRYIGVFFSKQHRKWFARCRTGAHRYWLGYFNTEVDAARAYDRMAVELFPELARVNFPEEWPPERRAEVHAQSPHGTQSPPASTRKAKSPTRTRKGESSFARKSIALKRPKSKKPKAKNRKPRAETPGRRDRKRTTKAKDRGNATRRKTKGRETPH